MIDAVNAMLDRIERLSTALAVTKGELSAAKAGVWESQMVVPTSFGMGGANNREQLRILMVSLTHSRKLEAIKAYRSLTGDGLLESKNAIEAAYMQHHD